MYAGGVAGGSPVPADSPPRTARSARRRPRPPSPLQRLPLPAPRLPAAASHSRVPPAASAAQSSRRAVGARGACPGGAGAGLESLPPLSFNTVLGVLPRAIRPEKEIKGIQIGKEDVKLSLHSNNFILYVEN